MSTLSRSPRDLFFLLILVILAGVPSRAHAQTTRVGAIRGVVVIDDSSRAPIPLADVYIGALARFARTDSAGRFFIGDLPNGSYEVRTRRLGFEPVLKSLAVNAADTVDYELALTPLAQLVSQVDIVAPAVPVKPAVTPEERNRRSSMGRFVTFEELEKMGDRRLSEVLYRLSGLRIVNGRRGQAWVAVTGTRGGSSSTPLSSYDLQNGADGSACYSSIVVDKQQFYGGRPQEALFDINRIGSYMVEELEWFANNSFVPVQYSSFGTTCGLLIIRLRQDG
ncbi:MAG: carboxypeptidase regulatory-like domain-containing protein [Gemmatimonadaceae bacterium]